MATIAVENFMIVGEKIVLREGEKSAKRGAIEDERRGGFDQSN